MIPTVLRICRRQYTCKYFKKLNACSGGNCLTDLQITKLFYMQRAGTFSNISIGWFSYLKLLVATAPLATSVILREIVGEKLNSDTKRVIIRKNNQV